MAYLPEQLIGLKERGRPKRRACADLVIFNLDKLGLEKVHWKDDLPGKEAQLIGAPFVSGTGILVG